MRWPSGRSNVVPAATRLEQVVDASLPAVAPVRAESASVLDEDFVEITCPITGDPVVDLFHYNLALLNDRQALALHRAPCSEPVLTAVRAANVAAREAATRSPEVAAQVRIALGIVRDLGIEDAAVRRWIECAALALAARRLLGCGAWDARAYNDLTRTWRIEIGPLHPDDQPLGEDVPADAHELVGAR